jgi:hypothetical protein
VEATAKATSRETGEHKASLRTNFGTDWGATIAASPRGCLSLRSSQRRLLPKVHKGWRTRYASSDNQAKVTLTP